MGQACDPALTACVWGRGMGPGLWEEGMGPQLSPSPWLMQDSDYVVAVRNFLPEDPALLAFHKGDIIHLQPLEPPRLGQCQGGTGCEHGGGGVGASPAGTDTGPACRLQCGLCGRQEGGVPGGAAAPGP